MREMAETKRYGHSTPIYGFGESFKSAPKPAEKKTPKDMDAERDRPVLAWSVRWVLSFPARRISKRSGATCILSVKTLVTEAKTFVLYRRQMLALLRFPKPTFDQLAIELPMLMGFRSSEVGTWRAEYIDYAMGDTLVLDSKKKLLFTVPLNTIVARHAEMVLNGRSKGLVLRSRSNAQPDPNRPLRTESIWHIWHKWTRLAGLPNAADISPLVGRRFFAAEWIYGQGLSLVTLQKILRHSHFETTMRYVAGLVFYEDVRRDYGKFQMRLMQEVAAHNA